MVQLACGQKNPGLEVWVVGSQSYLSISFGIQVDAMLDLELLHFLETPLKYAREREREPEQATKGSSSGNVRSRPRRVQKGRSETRAYCNIGAAE